MTVMFFRDLAVNTLAQSNSSNYLGMVDALTVKAAEEPSLPKLITDNPSFGLLFSPLLIYGAIIIFFLLFFGGLIWQVANRVFDWKKMFTTLVVALMVASTPVALQIALKPTSLQTRASADEVPRNVLISPIDKTTIEITWETTAAKIGLVRYGTAPLTEGYGQTAIGNSGEKTVHHRVSIERVKPNTLYEFEILSGATWYANNGKPLQFKLPN